MINSIAYSFLKYVHMYIYVLCEYILCYNRLIGWTKYNTTTAANASRTTHGLHVLPHLITLVVTTIYVEL